MASSCYEPVVHVTHVQPTQTIVAPAPRPRTSLAAESLPQEDQYFKTGPPLSETPITKLMEHDDWFQSSFGSLWANIGTDFADFTKADFGLRFQAPGSIGIETSVVNLRESTKVFRDHIWIGDVNLTYEAINRGNLRGRLGLGVNWMNDGWGSVAGFNLTTGMDLKIDRNWLLVGEADLGSLGDADYFHGRLSLNRRFGNVEWATGIDHLDIGGVDITTGFTGIQFRF